MGSKEEKCYCVCVRAGGVGVGHQSFLLGNFICLVEGGGSGKAVHDSRENKQNDILSNETLDPNIV